MAGMIPNPLARPGHCRQHRLLTQVCRTLQRTGKLFFLSGFGVALTACASLPTKPASLSPAFPTIGPVFLDADTANEMDDLYAVAQVILDPEMDIAALGSAHFNNVEIGTKGRWHQYDVAADLDRGLNTVAASQAENEAILKMLERTDIPHPRGAQWLVCLA